MNLILDTHAWLWWILEPERLPDSAGEVIRDPGNTVYLSAVSSWEIAIKYGLGRLYLPEPPAQFIPTRIARDRLEPLAITHVHAAAVAELPPHHRDPFDRLLVAQAQTEGATIVTMDNQIRRYDVAVLFAAEPGKITYHADPDEPTRDEWEDA